MKGILLDTLSRRSLAVRLVLWGLVVSLFVCLGMAGPKSLRRVRFSAYDCPPTASTFDPSICGGVEMSKGQAWKHSVTSISAPNQYLMLEFEAENAKFNNFSGFRNELFVTVSLYGGFSSDNMEPILTNVIHRRHLVCEEDRQACNKIPVLHLAWLKYTNYEIHVDFSGTPNIDSINFMGDVVFQLATVNPQYTEFTIVIKWLYILMTVEALVLYRRRLRQVPSDHRIPAQGWIASLLVALLLFNDPLCLTGVVGGFQPSWAIPLLSTLCQVSFVFLLLLFWIVVLDSLKTDPRLQTEGSDACEVFKYAIVAWAWLSTCGLLTWLRFHQVNDPTLTYMSDFPYFDLFLNLTIAIASVYVFWLIHLVLQARTELEAEQVECRRFVVVLLLSCCVMGFFVFGSIMGVVPYIAEGELTHTKGWHFSAMHGLVNCFCFFMAYLFTPSHESEDSVFDALYKDRGNFHGEL